MVSIYLSKRLEGSFILQTACLFIRLQVVEAIWSINYFHTHLGVGFGLGGLKVIKMETSVEEVCDLFLPPRF